MSEQYSHRNRMPKIDLGFQRQDVNQSAIGHMAKQDEIDLCEEDFEAMQQRMAMI